VGEPAADRAVDSGGRHLSDVRRRRDDDQPAARADRRDVDHRAQPVRRVDRARLPRSRVASRRQRGLHAQPVGRAARPGRVTPALTRGRVLEYNALMLVTTIAGSLPKPAWLAEPERLWAPWRVPPEHLAEAQRDAVLAALKEQESAGIDIVTDGEQSRQHFVHGFLERISGIDFTRRVTIGIRADRYKAEVPIVSGPITRTGPVHVAEVRWARAHTAHRLKFTIPGPMTIV